MVPIVSAVCNGVSCCQEKKLIWQFLRIIFVVVFVDVVVVIVVNAIVMPLLVADDIICGCGQ